MLFIYDYRLLLTSGHDLVLITLRLGSQRIRQGKLRRPARMAAHGQRHLLHVSCVVLVRLHQQAKELDRLHKRGTKQ